MGESNRKKQAGATVEIYVPQKREYGINPQFKLPEIDLVNLMSCTSIIIYNEWGIIYASSDQYDFIDYYTKDMLNNYVQDLEQNGCHANDLIICVMEKTKVLQQEIISADVMVLITNEGSYETVRMTYPNPDSVSFSASANLDVGKANESITILDVDAAIQRAMNEGNKII